MKQSSIKGIYFQVKFNENFNTVNLRLHYLSGVRDSGNLGYYLLTIDPHKKVQHFFNKYQVILL